MHALSIERIQALHDLAEVLREVRPTIGRHGTAFPAVTPNVDGEHAPTRIRFRDGVPAATMKSSRVHEEMGACQQLGDIDGVR
jgi:hypothetical protein